jgi:acetyl esterase/lipase
MGGISLEGQGEDKTPSPLQSEKKQAEFDKKRRAFVMQAVANGSVLHSIWPPFPQNLELIDPALNVHPAWPPTAIVHGNKDFMIPMSLSKNFESLLKNQGVETEFIEVEGEPHTFLAKMVKGSPTWDTQRRGFDFLETILKRSYSK